MLRAIVGLVLALSGALVIERAEALEQAELGVRINVLYGNGSFYGAGLHLRRFLHDSYFVTATLNRQNFAAARLPAWSEQQDMRIPTVQSTIAGVNVGRRQHLGDAQLMWFWSMGLAVGFPQASRTGPGQIQLEAETEVHLRSALGIETLMADHWSLTAAVRIERHYVNLKYNEPGSDGKTTLSTLTPSGVYLSLGYRF